MYQKILLASLLICGLCLPSLNAQDKRPKIGVTLSGGGARGLAHIGILKAIDSAGLQVDYLTGTSMGSIVGGLYAIGYSGKEIEALAGKLNWGLVLSNESPLTSIIMEEKSEYKRYALELPLDEGHFKLPTGVVESEELWLTLSELFFPAYRYTSFNQFSIPFACIATDASTGEAVVLNKGQISTALRASMAIPSFFTAVEIDDRSLVDGGIVRNFPVSDVRKMGADIVIGVNVSTGLNTKEKLTSPISVLSNIIFFKEAENTRSQVDLCDIYVPVAANEFGAASFNRSREIIDSGIAVGNALYPRFKALADSLNQRFGKQSAKSNRLPQVDSLYISGYEVKGLVHTHEKFFLEMMGFQKGRFYTPTEISRRIRKGFGTRYYNRITYHIAKDEAGSARLIFTVEENPLSTAKLSLHYNSFSGISLVANFTTRNLLTQSSRSYVTVNVGENLRLRAEHMEYLGKRKNLSVSGKLNLEEIEFKQYSDFKQYGSYRQKYLRLGADLAYSYKHSQALGIGGDFTSLRFDPSLIAIFDIKGKNTMWTGTAFYRLNTLDRNTYPSRGWRVHVDADGIFRQKGELTFFAEGTPILNTDSLDLSFDPYSRATVLAENYQRLGTKGLLISMAQLGMNFGYQQYFTNDFIVGGLTRQFRNQVVFAGYQENQVHTSSIATLQLGYQYTLFDKFLLTWRSNMMAYGFIERKNQSGGSQFLSGHALTASYLTAIGPVEFSMMYGDQSKKLNAYVNVGLHF